MLPTMPEPQCVSCLQWNQMAIKRRKKAVYLIFKTQKRLTIFVGDVNREGRSSHEARVKTNWSTRVIGVGSQVSTWVCKCRLRN